MVARNNPKDIRIVRTYDAPVQLVWEAWNDPEQVAKWWGPRGFTLTTHSKDLRPGGHWFYTMHGPDGVDYINKTIYYEVEECKKLVYDHGGNDERAPLFRVTALFTETDGQTTLVMTMTLPTAEEAANTRKFIKAAGGNATWDRLAEYLAHQQHQKNAFVIHRTFEAAPEIVFDWWVNAEQLVRWLPPSGFTMELLKADIRVGGTSLFRMSNGEMNIFGQLEYRELDCPTRLVYVQRFCDADGQPARHPALPLFPQAVLTQVTFTTEDEDNTRVTLVCEPLDTTDPQEIETFVQTRTSMTGGWTNSFDQLESELTEQAALTKNE